MKTNKNLKIYIEKEEKKTLPINYICVHLKKLGGKQLNSKTVKR